MTKHESTQTQLSDPIFDAEQKHLSQTYAKLTDLSHITAQKLETSARLAAQDKEAMAEELTSNFATDDDILETLADFEAVNRIIAGYNLSQTVEAEKLAALEVLLRQPYFAKIDVQFKPDAPAKSLYLGTAGISDENYKRLIVDWRSPIAEVYYNQEIGPTSYVAEGRTINVDLLIRRQFDITRDTLHAYFDTSVAIEDSLLLASLSHQRSAHMRDITATIQKEQNNVIRHKDVPALLVFGIAGSGKTSVLLQRIAYLFYQERETLDPSQVYLITPNEVFAHYIDSVLPDLGERNPEMMTWDAFAQTLLPEGRGVGDASVPLSRFTEIDQALSSFEFDAHDFRDITLHGVRLISADSIRKLSEKYNRAPAGPHRVTLMREELTSRLEGRLKAMAATEAAQLEAASLEVNEQLALFNETFDPQTEEEARSLTLTYLNSKFASAFALVERDEWLRIDRIGMRLLHTDGLTSVEWLYVKMAVSGLCNTEARYVMVDEVQDYSVAQLAVLAKYFRRAHFLLLGDPNQAINKTSSSYSEIAEVFNRAFGEVARADLMTSYRSTPAITELFAKLARHDDHLKITSIQRQEQVPVQISCPDEQTWINTLREAVYSAEQKEGLSAIIVPFKDAAKRIQKALGKDAPKLLSERGSLPESGVVMLTLKLAKGLEFDRVIVPDASERTFPNNDLARRRLYTTISRATRELTIISEGALTPLLDD
ncbi:UvrD-helicase domain-containing protein [Eggerthellaceae bacterium 3-80]|nr:DNA helicase [bacterium D16-34]